MKFTTALVALCLISSHAALAADDTPVHVPIPRDSYDPRPVSACNGPLDTVPCAVFTQEIERSSYETGGQIWSRNAFTITRLNFNVKKSKDPRQTVLGIKAKFSHANIYVEELGIDSFELEIANYEPQCMAYWETQDRPADVATLWLKAGRRTFKNVKMNCTFGRAYDAGPSYDFAPGVRSLDCTAKTNFLGQELKDRMAFNLTMRLPSENTTTANPCKDRKPNTNIPDHP